MPQSGHDDENDQDGRAQESEDAGERLNPADTDRPLHGDRRCGRTLIELDPDVGDVVLPAVADIHKLLRSPEIDS
jgi:hypothetical protein